MATFNFNSLKKKTMTVILPDERKTALIIGVPSKSIMDEIISIYENLDENNGYEVMETVYDLYSKILNGNKNNIKITPEQIEEMFDFEDVLLFIKSYVKFINEVTGTKN